MKVHRIPLNKRVRLRGDRTGVYALARAGAEGWIRARDVDPVGFYSMVLVEWDKEHWTYNGQEDMWTYEDHFEPVEEGPIEGTNMSKPSREELRRAFSVIEGALSDNEPEQHDDVEFVEADAAEERPRRIGPLGGFEPTPPEHYKEILRRAVEHAVEGEAFVVVSVRQETNPFQNDKMAMIPRIFKAEKTEESATLLGAQLANLAREIHAELAVEKIENILLKKGEAPGPQEAA